MLRRHQRMRIVALSWLVLPACSGLRLQASTVPLPEQALDAVGFDVDADGSLEVAALLGPNDVQVADPTSGHWRATSVEVDHPVDALASAGPTSLALLHSGTGRMSMLHGRVGGEPVLAPHATLPALAASPIASLRVHRVSEPWTVVLVGGTPLRLTLARSDGAAGGRAVPLTPRPRVDPPLALTDSTGDGRLDIVLGMSTGDPQAPIPDHLRVYRTSDAGALADEAWVRVPSPLSLATGDVDGDGWTDVAVFGHEGAWLMRNLGGGWLAAPTQIERGHFVDGALADLDGNGRCDLVAVDRVHARLVARRSLGGGAGPAWGPKAAIALPPEPAQILSLGRRTDQWLFAIRHEGPAITIVTVDPDDAPDTADRRTSMRD